MMVSPMNLFSYSFCDLHRARTRLIFVHCSIPVLGKVLSYCMICTLEKKMCCVVMTDFSPNLGSTIFHTQSHFNGNFITFLICKMGTKIPTLQYYCKNQRQDNKMYSP